MKKLFATLAAGLFSVSAIAQTYPAPTFNSLILQNPLTPANGGTGATTSTGTGSVVLSNSPSIASPTVTGAFTATGLVTTADHATQAANTVLANGTGSTASPTALAVPSCSTSASALDWASGTGFTCNTSVNAATLGSATFAAPGTIGGTTPGAASFTTLSSSGLLTGSTNQFATTVTSQPPTFVGNLNPVSYTAITGDNVNAGGGFIEGAAVNYSFGGSSMQGGRAAFYAQFQQSAATSASSTNRNYVASQGTAYTASGDGGTNLTSGAKGGYFSFGGNTFVPSGATNLLEASGGEIDTDTQAGSSMRYLIGWSVVGNNSVQGSSLDAAYDIGGAVVSVYGPHVGWNYGIAFDDIHGNSPVNSSSTLLAGYFPTLGVQTINRGIDLSAFNCSQFCFNSTGFSVNGVGQVAMELLNVNDTAASDTGAVVINATSNSNGANIAMNGNGGTTPGKFLQAKNGSFNILNNGFSADILSLTDSGNLTVTGSVKPAYPAGVVGNTTGSAVTAGSLGEIIANTPASAGISTGTSTNLASITLTPGQWDVMGNVIYAAAASTTMSNLNATITTTSATIGGVKSNTQSSATYPANVQASIAPPVVSINVSTNTTVFLVGQATFASGSVNQTGWIWAERR